MRGDCHIMTQKPSTMRREAMINSLTDEPIRVSKYPGAWPYIRVPLEQLDRVKKLLDDSGFRYYVDEYALSVNGEPYTSVVNLEHRADVVAIQRLLDECEEHEMTPGGR
jgi:hypothetical protein